MNASITIDEAMVDAWAPNAAAIKNGRKLVLKGSFVALHRSEDGTLLFGTCLGSGKNPYECSSDFAQPDKPVHRCNCPSRQFPCKHSLGLLYAYAQGKPFTVADVPADIAAKREQAQVREAKKKERAAKPRKVNKSALSKKIKAQLNGLDLLEKLTFDLVRLGMGNTSAKTASQIEAQAKQLGDAYLPGAQAALHAYTMLFADEDGRFDAELSAGRREAIYGEAFAQLTRLHALIRQGRVYLKKRLEDPDLKPDTETTIAAWLGHAWQLTELAEAGRTQANAEMIQLAFHSHDDRARREYIDTGIWLNLSSGQVQLTQAMRPYTAAKFIRSEDSFFQVAQVPELCIYPGQVNPRVRWASMVPRPVTRADFATIRKWAEKSAAATIKTVKAALRSPLAEQHPIHVLQFKHVGRVENDLVLEDAEGVRLALTDVGMRQEPASCHLLSLLPSSLLADQTMVCRFRNDLDSKQLRIKPLAIVTDAEIVRLTF